MPAHRGDNYRDPSTPGPESWRRRPVEISRAINVVGQDPRFRPLLTLDKVGMYGMSAGGHTALSLAGGRWSPASFRQHCESHISVPLQRYHLARAYRSTSRRDRCRGSLRGGLRHGFAGRAARARGPGDGSAGHVAHPAVPGERVLRSCEACVRIADVPNGGHGALLSPLPPGLTGLVGDLLNDPPGLDRAVLPDIDRKIVEFLRKHLLPTRADSARRTAWLPPG